MPSDWSRADTLSAIAVCISLIAAMASTYQTRIAARKERDEKRSFEPIADPIIRVVSDMPEVFELILAVHNRDDFTLVADRLRILKPRDVRVANFRAIAPYGGADGRRQLPNPVPISAFSRCAINEFQIGPRGSTRSGPMSPISNNIAHEAYILSVPLKRPWYSSTRLIMSLRLSRRSRITESIEIPIIVSVPQTTAKTAS